MRFSTFALIQWSWVKNSKWNQPQFHGRGSENLIRFNFDLFLWPKTVCLVHVTFLRKTLQNLLFNVDRHKILWSDSWWKNEITSEVYKKHIFSKSHPYPIFFNVLCRKMKNAGNTVWGYKNGWKYKKKFFVNSRCYFICVLSSSIAYKHPVMIYIEKKIFL